MPKRYILFALSMVALAGCIEPFSTPAIKDQVNILVIDGFVDSSNGSVRARLSKAVALSDPASPAVVDDAQVSLEDALNHVVVLTYVSNGVYSAEGLAIDINLKYRLRVRTNGKEYLSELIELKTSPPIDSVSWRPTPDGTEIMVNTHDDTMNSRYYLWTFEETWEYTAPWPSSLILKDTEVVYRSPEENIYRCWKDESSSKILVGSSFRLEKDIISQRPIHFLPKGSGKIGIRYSINVKQMAITQESYNFWSMLQESTEGLGGLFDPQPGKVVGNFSNVADPKEPVLGYFSGGSVTEKRLFIRISDLPEYLRVYRTEACPIDTLLIEDFDSYNPSANLLVSEIRTGPEITGYTITTPYCADCRTRGGTTTIPSFWH